MIRAPAPSWRASSCKPSTTPYPSHVTGPMTIARLMIVMIAAASFGRSPSKTDSQLYGGYSATVRTMLQTRMGMNGRIRTNDQ